jgi:site-specific recombinase XerD
MDSLIVSFEHYLQGASYAAHTSLAYSRDIREFVHFLSAQGIAVESLQSEHIFIFFQHVVKKKISSATELRKVAALRCFFQHLATEYRLPDMSSALETALALSPKRISQLIESYKDKTTYRDIRIFLILSLLATGKINIRKIATLRTYNFCFKTCVVTIESARQPRTIQLKEDFFATLRHYLNALPSSSTYLFQTKVGASVRPISTQALRSLLKKVLFPQVPLPSSSTSLDSDLKEIYTKKHPRP